MQKGKRRINTGHLLSPLHSPIEPSGRNRRSQLPRITPPYPVHRVLGELPVADPARRRDRGRRRRRRPEDRLGLVVAPDHGGSPVDGVAPQGGRRHGHADGAGEVVGGVARRGDHDGGEGVAGGGDGRRIEAGERARLGAVWRRHGGWGGGGGGRGEEADLADHGVDDPRPAALRRIHEMMSWVARW